jgi:FMN reductase
MPRVLGVGGSLKPGSSSLGALRVALAGAESAGALTETVEIAAVGLPFYAPGPRSDAPDEAHAFAERVHAADALILSSPLYHGSISGSFKNAIDWLQLLADRKPPYLTDKVVGLLAAAGGTQGLQAINTMEFIVRALRGWAVPLVPVARAWQVFDREGAIRDEAIAQSLRGLGLEVVRATKQLIQTGTCDYADDPRPGVEGDLGALLTFRSWPGPGDSEGG